MKRIVFGTILALSLVLNIVAVTFIASYISTAHHLKVATDERSILATNLKYAQTANVVNEIGGSTKVDKRAFISHYDGTEDVFAVEPVALPAGVRDVTLFVDFHGLGSTCMGPFENPKDPTPQAILELDHSYVVMAPNYRAPAGWVSDGALADITQNIRLLCQQYPVKHIYLIGASMGGCVALSYSALAPDDIKQRICGVISIEGSGDLAQLYHKSAEPTLRSTMDQCFGGPPERVSAGYAAKSLLPNISTVPLQTRYAIISAERDRAVPPELQTSLYKALQAQRRPVNLISVDMEHGPPPLDSVLKSLDFVLKGASRTR